ncbi:hypothetical protein JTE90_025343 [Oedothorax gibbosus]|uniref:Uncharacterized protein n=1 Tax=Oedothorax gibbosus TaxID=931172 RepID=A0AAV6V838_9ARAC|nr:hypothetical protein JTE90_025343 [Oedothorax gibbosus]
MSLKRKADFGEGSKKGSFTAEDVPPTMFSLGDDLFACCNYFNKSILIHIRRYKKYGEKLLYSIPLKSPRDPVSIISESQLIIRDEVLLFDANDILFELTESNVTLKKDVTSRNGKTTTKKVTANSEQWEMLFSIGDSVMSCAIREKYRRSSFLEIFELVTRTSTLYEASADEVEDVEDTLYNLLQSAFYDVIAERSGLVNPRATIDDSLLEKNTVRAFNAHVLNLGLFYIVEEFYKNICEFRFPNHRCHRLSSFLTKQFLNSVNVSDMIERAREAFCKFSK